MSDIKFYDVLTEKLKEKDSKAKEVKSFKDKDEEIARLKLELEDVRYKSYKEGYDEGVDAGFWMAVRGMATDKFINSCRPGMTNTDKFTNSCRARKEDVC